MEPEDYDTGHDHMPGGDDDYYEDIESDILESVIILALTGALAFLVYYRAQRQRRAEERRQQQQQQGQGQRQADNAPREEADDQGVFPQRNDPEFLNWAAGGVGH
jgi:SEL1 protein